MGDGYILPVTTRTVLLKTALCEDIFLLLLNADKMLATMLGQLDKKMKSALSLSVVIETGFLTGRIHPGTTIFIIAYINRGPKGLKTKNIEDNITFWISCFNSKSQGTKNVFYIRILY